MANELLKTVERFQAETGLSDHRVGIVLANNGRLLERLRRGGRIWPETVKQIKDAIKRERISRACDEKGAA